MDILDAVESGQCYQISLKQFAFSQKCNEGYYAHGHTDGHIGLYNITIIYVLQNQTFCLTFLKAQMQFNIVNDQAIFLMCRKKQDILFHLNQMNTKTTFC